MAIATWTDIHSIIKNILSDENYLSKIRQIFDRNFSFLECNSYEFISYLASLLDLDGAEYSFICQKTTDGKKLLEDAFRYIVFFEQNRNSRIYDEAEYCVNVTNFMQVIREINKLRENVIPLKKTKQVVTSKITPITDSKDETVKMLNDIVASKDEANRLCSEIRTIKIDLETILNNFEKTSKKEYRKRFQDCEDALNTDVKNITEKYNGMLVKEQDTLNEKREAIIKQQADLENDIKDFKKKTLKEIHEIEDNVHREELARYFYNEKKKRKGDIPMGVLAFAIVLFASYWRRELLQPYITDKDVIVRLLLSFIASIVISQILKNIVDNLESIAGFIYRVCKTILDRINGRETNGEDQVKASSKVKLIVDFVAMAGRIVNLHFFKELLTPYWCWLTTTFVGMYAIGNVAMDIYQRFETTQIKYTDLLPYTAGYMLLIWFTWFSSKQFSYVKQVCDDYEYKYALSKSYLSYKNEARKLADDNKDGAIMIALLDAVIKNVAQSPATKVQKDCHTPFTEIVSALKGVDKNDPPGPS